MAPSERLLTSSMLRNLRSYRNVDEFLLFMNQMAEQSPLARVVVIGTGDAAFRAIEIGDVTKPLVAFEANTHAREPATTELALTVASYLLRDGTNDPLVAGFLSTSHVVIIPIHNESGMRMVMDPRERWIFWRKTALQEELNQKGTPDYVMRWDAEHPGVNTNRNWGPFPSGETSKPMDHFYSGNKIMNSPLVKNQWDYLAPLFKKNGGIYVSFHSPDGYVVHTNEDHQSRELARDVAHLFLYKNVYAATLECISTAAYKTVADYAVLIELGELDETGFFPHPEQVWSCNWEAGMRQSLQHIMRVAGRL